MKVPLIALIALTAAVSAKTIPNYAEANLVIGQVDFTSRLAPAPPTAASLSEPCSVVLDPVTRKVFIVDPYNNRVLRYASADSLANGAAAEAVFGQPLFTTQTRAVTRDQFGGVYGSMFLDAKGRLWLADTTGDRVLRFDAASFRDSSPNADGVFGQPDFTTGARDFNTGTSNTTATKMYGPRDVCVDASDRLWVADSYNHRVLRFDSITTKPNGAAADGVLGQPDFTARASGSTGKNGMDSVNGVTISTNGTLYVTCTATNRVMRFSNAAGLANNSPADAVFGQPDFTTISSGTTAAKLNKPHGSWITPDDSLWVADTCNHRLLRFNNASSKTNGAAADGVLGQPDFTTYLEAVTRRGMYSPLDRPFVDTTGSVWIADSGNNRVLRFSPDITPPVLAVTTALNKILTKPAVVIKGTASDTYGISKVEYRIGTGPLKLATGTTAWSFKAALKKGKNVITIIATDVDGIPSLSQVIKVKRK